MAKKTAKKKATKKKGCAKACTKPRTKSEIFRELMEKTDLSRKQVVALFDEMSGERIVGPQFSELSMGMSSDYEVAIQEGATLLRIGSAIFA